MQRHLHEVNGLMGKHDLRYSLGNRLDEINRIALDGGDNFLGKFAVVHRKREVIGGGGRSGRDMRDHVDHKFLPISPLVVEHAVEAGCP